MDLPAKLNYSNKVKDVIAAAGLVGEAKGRLSMGYFVALKVFMGEFYSVRFGFGLLHAFPSAYQGHLGNIPAHRPSHYYILISSPREFEISWTEDESRQFAHFWLEACPSNHPITKLLVGYGKDIVNKKYVSLFEASTGDIKPVDGMVAVTVEKVVSSFFGHLKVADVTPLIVGDFFKKSGVPIDFFRKSKGKPHK